MNDCSKTWWWPSAVALVACLLVLIEVRPSWADEAYFLAHVADIDKKRKKASIPIQMSMAGALMGMGMRTKKINKAALKVARAIGPITHSETCDPFDVAKHLTSDYAKQKLGL